MIGAFHFLRPEWLLALVPVILLWWRLRRRTDAAQAWRGIIAPHLLPHLLSGKESVQKFGPLELLGLAWLITVIAIAGPTWQQEPSPFADDTAALAIVIKVTPSMMTEDVQPSRFARSVEKIRDLLAQRRGAKTSLVAYAGTAHIVMPATTDGGIINTFAAALNPKIMPSDGDVTAEALRLADQTLASSGSILLITDAITPEQSVAVTAWRKSSRTPVRLLPPLLPGTELDAVRAQSRLIDASVVSLTADDSDAQTIAHAAKFSVSNASEAGERWEENGYFLTPVLGLLLLPFFRRGWMLPTASKV